MLPILYFEGPVQHLPYQLDEGSPHDFCIPSVPANVFCLAGPVPSPTRVGSILDVQKFKGSSVFNMPAIIRLKMHFALRLLPGKRRLDDYQHHLESLLSSKNLPTVAVSTNIVHHLPGDPIDMRALGMRTDLVILGLVFIALGGPPCETCSVATMNQVFDSDGITMEGPRPLHSLEQVWGLPCLPRAEREQEAIENILLLAMIQFSSAASTSSLTMVVMENPKRTWIPNAASSACWPNFCGSKHCLLPLLSIWISACLMLPHRSPPPCCVLIVIAIDSEFSVLLITVGAITVVRLQCLLDAEQMAPSLLPPPSSILAPRNILEQRCQKITSSPKCSFWNTTMLRAVCMTLFYFRLVFSVFHEIP